MISLRTSFFLFSLTFILSGCEISDIAPPVLLTEADFIVPVGLDADVDLGPTGTIDYSLEFKPFAEGNYANNLASFGTVSENRMGETILYLGLADQETGNAVEEPFKFTLRFSLPGFDAERTYAPADLLPLFPVGRRFPFGTGPDSVQLGIMLEEDDMGNQRSRSDYVLAPEGRVRVESIEEFSAGTDLVDEGQMVFTVVTFSFDGIVGIYRSEEDSRQFFYEGHRASKNARVTGTVSLNLAAKPL